MPKANLKLVTYRECVIERAMLRQIVAEIVRTHPRLCMTAVVEQIRHEVSHSLNDTDVLQEIWAMIAGGEMEWTAERELVIK